MPPVVLAAEDEMEIRLQPAAWDWLELTYECRNLFGEDVRRALASGLPTRLRIDIELWEDRSNLWDRSVTRVEIGYRMIFDVLEADYEVFDADGALVMTSPSLEDVEEVVGREENLELVSLDELDVRAEYFVMMEVELEPLSVREVQDLERWIRGSMSEERGGEGLSGISGHLFGVLKNQVGMGERKGMARSESFRPAELKARSLGPAEDR